MDQEPDVIRHDIEQTRSALTEKLEALEGEVRDKVETAKETVEETIANVKATVRETVDTVKRTFDVRYQVDRHPWAMVGGSALAGFLIGSYFGRRESRATDRSHRFQTGASLSNLVHTQSRGGYETYREREAPQPEQPGVIERLRHQFEGEIDKIKGVAIGAAMGWLRDAAEQALPQLAPHINEVMNSATHKLGGTPIEQPLQETASPSGNGRQETAYCSNQL
jgi:ElaB/YqjD/DUF883 family membrane-anchored ribosome-binding protein